MSQTKAQLISDLVQALNFTGTSSAPANGLFLSATNTLQLSTASTSRLTINSDGHVDVVGNLDVGAGLDVTGAISATGNITANGNIRVQNTFPTYYLTDTDSDSDFFIQNANGNFNVKDETNNVVRFTINSSGTGTFAGNLDVGAGLDVTGAITCTGDLTIPDKLIHSGDTNTAIRFPENDHISFEVGLTGEAIRIDNGGKLLIGLDDRRLFGTGVTSILQIEGLSSATSSSLSIVNNQNTTGSPNIRLGKTRGTSIGSNTTVANGDSLGQIIFYGADGTNIYNPTALIGALVNGTVGTDTIPTDLVFQTSATTGTGRGERMRITSAGRVGIGTTAPGAEFTVVGTSGSTTAQFIQGANTVTDRTIIAQSTNGNNIGAFVDGSNIRHLVSGQNDILTTDAGNYLALHTNSGTERMRIISTGLVGIGTSSPSAALTISCTGQSNGIRLIDSSTSSGTPSFEIIGKRSDSNGNTSFAANVYLGKNRTDQKVTSGIVLGSINFGGNHTDGSESNISYAASIRGQSGDSFDSKSDMPTDLVFCTGVQGRDRDGEAAGQSNPGTQRLKIDSVGDVHVSKRIVIANNSAAFPAYSFTNSNTTGFYRHTNNQIGVSIAGAAEYRFTNGQFGPLVNDANDLGSSNHRWDDVFATNGTINTSDQNLKNTIVTSDLGLDFINKLNPVSYKFNGKTRTHYGLIAQEIETVLNTISKSTTDFAGFCKDEVDDDGNSITPTYGLRYSEFISPIIKAIQELSTKVATLEAA